MKQITVYEFDDYYEICKILNRRGFKNTGVTQDKQHQWDNRIEYLEQEGELVDENLLTADQFFDLIHDFHDITCEIVDQVLEEYKS